MVFSGLWRQRRRGGERLNNGATETLVAREAMKYLDNDMGPVKRPIRRSLQALMDAKRFRFEYYMKEYCQQMRESTQKLSGRIGLNADTYRGWLRARKLADTFANRIQFLAHFDANNEDATGGLGST